MKKKDIIQLFTNNFNKKINLNNYLHIKKKNQIKKILKFKRIRVLIFNLKGINLKDIIFLIINSRIELKKINFYYEFQNEAIITNIFPKQNYLHIGKYKLFLYLIKHFKKIKYIIIK